MTTNSAMWFRPKLNERERKRAEKETEPTRWLKAIYRRNARSRSPGNFVDLHIFYWYRKGPLCCRQHRIQTKGEPEDSLALKNHRPRRGLNLWLQTQMRSMLIITSPQATGAINTSGRKKEFVLYDKPHAQLGNKHRRRNSLNRVNQLQGDSRDPTVHRSL